MEKLLIAHHSEEFAYSLYQLLHEQFQVTVCFDGNSAFHLIPTLKPGVLVIDLSLPYRSGFSILEQLYPHTPPIILATTSHNSDILSRSPIAPIIRHIFLSTCEVKSIADYLHDIMDNTNCMSHNKSTYIQQILDDLHFPCDRDGYTQLLTAIPLYSLDPAQRFSKELYPAVAKLCGFGSGVQVERSIRSAIADAWKHTSPDDWAKYLLCTPDKIPSNKQFIAGIANYLQKMGFL